MTIFSGALPGGFAGGFGCGCSRFSLTANLTVTLFDRPGLDRAQGRRAQCLSGAQTEAGVMPGAAHRVVDDQTVDKRSMIVRAMRPDRENVVPPPHQ